MTTERMEVERMIPADAAAIFRVLSDPQGHVTIDSSGMLMDATGEPVTAVGDRFVVHMDREALNDYPMGLYDVTVIITTFVPDRGSRVDRGVISPPIGHIYGYRSNPWKAARRDLVLRLVDDRRELERGQRLPDHPRIRAPRHPRRPRPHGRAREPQRVLRCSISSSPR